LTQVNIVQEVVPMALLGRELEVLAAVVLGGPAFLARIATNPKRINELIKLNKLGKTPKRLAAQATILMNKVTDDIAAEGLGEDTMLEAVFSGQQ